MAEDAPTPSLPAAAPQVSEPHNALGPVAAFRRSWAIFMRRPVSMLSLGAALFTSFAAVCCGLGLFAAPWFMCELFALQIGSAERESPRRTRAWFAAGLLQLCATVVLTVLALLTLLALAPEAVAGSADVTERPVRARLIDSFVSTLVAGGCALAATVHVQYAPALLVDRGGSFYGAVLESARMVRASGFVRTWVTSAAAHALPLSAIAVFASVQYAFSSVAALTVVLVLGLPVVALCTALGHGMVVANYLALRRDVQPFRALRVSAAVLALGAALVLLLVAGPLLLATSLAKPTPLARGELHVESPLMDTVTAATTREIYVPGTALRVVAEASRVQVVASDGGGAGTLPLPEVGNAGRVARVRVARLSAPPAGVRLAPSEGRYAIEVRLDDGRSFVTTIDESGVRLDDSLGRRFALLLPRYSGFLLGLCWLWVVLWSARVLPRQAQTIETRTAEATGAALWAFGWLAPPALLSCALGLWVFIR